VIGARLKEIRSELELTQARFGALIAEKPNRVSDYENGGRVIPKKFALLSEALLEVHRCGGSIEAVSLRGLN